MSFFNEVFDLAAVATGAGLAGGGSGAVLAWMVSGAILRFIVRTVLTALLTGVGFYFLLGFLGFEIVPKGAAETRASLTKPVGETLFAPQSVNSASTTAQTAEDESKRKIEVKSPFRR